MAYLIEHAPPISLQTLQLPAPPRPVNSITWTCRPRLRAGLTAIAVPMTGRMACLVTAASAWIAAAPGCRAVWPVGERGRASAPGPAAIRLRLTPYPQALAHGGAAGWMEAPATAVWVAQVPLGATYPAAAAAAAAAVAAAAAAAATAVELQGKMTTAACLLKAPSAGTRRNWMRLSHCVASR